MKDQAKANISIAELEKVLLEEITLYESYASHLEKDSELMVNLKIEELEQSNKTKATLLLKIQNVEEARQFLVKKVASDRGITAEIVKVSDICETLNEKDSTRLVQLREKLLSVIVRIREIQAGSSQLVQSSLSWIEGSMATLRRLLSPAGTYNSRGRVDHPSAYAGTVVENKV